MSQVARPRVQLQCPGCDSFFLVSPYDAQRGAKCCSRSCSNTYRARNKSPLVLLETFVDKTSSPYGCWLWTGGIWSDGYARTCFRGKSIKVHRLSWEVYKGHIPEGMRVLHDCDKFYTPGDSSYRRCFNHYHLFLGSDTDNAKDMRQKMRHAWGERQGFAKFTEQDVHKIRRLLRQGERAVAIASQFGVTETAISCIKRGVSWRHLISPS